MPISNKKLLLLNVNREGWHSGNMIYDMESVSEACDTVIYGPGWPNYKHTDINKIIEQIYGKSKPDIIYSYFTPNERVQDVYMRHYRIPEELRYFPTNFSDLKGVLKIFALSDFWSRSREAYSRDLKNSNFDYCFCCFAPPYSNPRHFFKFFDNEIIENIKFIGHPRCVDKECYKDYGLDKKFDVVTVGAMQKFYPVRVHMHRYLSRNHEEHGINYINYRHCGVNFKHSNFVRENYAKAIAEGEILLSCGGKYNLAMNKIFEAMGVGTAYFGPEPYGAKELNMKDGYNFVSVDKNNFIEKIKYYLSNKDELKDIQINGSNTFKEYHNIQARASDFVKRINSIV